MRNLKALNAFVVAEQHRNASKLMYGLIRDDQSLQTRIGVPSIVCAALAFELYLKTLLQLERKKGHGHDLWELFHKLGRRNQQKIRKFWRHHSSGVIEYLHKTYTDAGEPVPKVDFEFVLRASRHAFVQVRYIHENGIAHDSGWAADTMMEGTRQVILTKRPSWRHARQAVLLPTTSMQPTSQPH